MTNTPHSGGEHARRVRKPHGRRTLATASATLALSAGGALGVGLADQQDAAPQAPRAVAATAPDPHGPLVTDSDAQRGSHARGLADPGDLPNHDVLPASPPVGISIPSLHVDAALERLGLNQDRTLRTPKDPDKAGWFTQSPSPGARGPAVLAGHVTWNGEPGVFFSLGAAKKGARIEVTRADGRVAVFSVERTVRYPKSQFPTLEVYGNLDHAGLRLITCGGRYSAADHRYADNVVVYASLTDAR
ncbi:class F sortase [Streptomyces sp. NPDC054842]